MDGLKAAILLNLKCYRAVLEALDAATAKGTDGAVVHWDCGVVLRRLKRHEEVAQAFREAARRDQKLKAPEGCGR